MDGSKWYSSYDNLSVAVYIIDANSYELLYLNEKLAKRYPDYTLGKTCYEAFYHIDKPCISCPIKCNRDKDDKNTLSPVGVGYNTAADGYYDIYEQLIHWDDGRPAHLCAFLDVINDVKNIDEIEITKSVHTIYQAYLKSMNTAFCAMDTDGNLLFANKIYKNMFEVSLKKGNRMPTENLISEYEIEHFNNNITPRVIAGERVCECFNVRGRDGNNIPVRAVLASVTDINGNIFAYTSSLEDISNEKSYVTARERLNLALSYSKIGVWEMSVAHKTFEFDDAFVRLMDVDWKSPVLISTFADYLSTIIDASANKTYLDYLKNFDGTIPIEFNERKYTFPDGSIRYMNISSTTYFDANGKPERIIGMLNDITDEVVERNKYIEYKEKQMRAQEFIAMFTLPFTQPIGIKKLMEDALNQLQDYFHTDRICIQIITDDKQFVTCKYEKCINEKVPSLLNTSIPLSDLEILVKAMQCNPYVYYENTNELFAEVPKVDYGAVSSLLMPMLCDGNILGYFILDVLWDNIHWDDNDLHLAQLACSVISGAYFTHTSELKLKEALAEAQAANKAKSDFLSRMSHEMRTPMNAIIGMSKIAQGSTDLDIRDNCANEVRLASEQLLGIINDVLDLSKIESGKLEFSYEPASFEYFIEKCCMLLNEQIISNDIKLDYKCGDNLKLFYFCDELRVSQVIMNLVSNAVKFTQSGGEIFISADEVTRMDDISFVELRVKDTGIGMSSEQIDRVFKTFEQADNSISRRFGGTGLGLSICKSLIETMGGSITVNSEVGTGSEFIVLLPLNYAVDYEKQFLIDAKCKATSVKLLVISNDKNILSIFNKLSSVLSWEIDIISSPQEYLQIERSGNTIYNLSFVDISIVTDEMCNMFTNNQDKPIADVTVFISNNILFHEKQKKHQNKVLYTPLSTLTVINTVTDAFDILHNDELSQDVIPDFSKINILVAEDIEINRFILCSLLEETKINIDEAVNGLEAVELFKNNPDKYDIIFMDLHMPEMNGLEATKVIRNMGTKKSEVIPIIALTASAFKENIDECINAGMNDHIPKPIDINVIIEKIKEYANK